MNEELHRLQEDRARTKHWKRWGPYLSERQWATVREDYSEEGDPWNYLPHDTLGVELTAGAKMDYWELQIASAGFASLSRSGTVGTRF